MNGIRLGNQGKKSAYELEEKLFPMYYTGFPSGFCIKILLHVSYLKKYISLVGKIYAAVEASLCMEILNFHISLCVEKKT